MLCGNILYLFSQFNSDMFTTYNLLVGILDIVLTIYLIYINIKSIINLNNNKYKKNMKFANTLVLISSISNFIYFCSILYRMDAFLLYILALISFIIIFYNIKATFKNPKSMYINLTTKKQLVIKIIVAFMIIASLFIEFWQFSNMSKIMIQMTDIETTQTSNDSSSYGLNTLYKKQQTITFIKFISSILLIFSMAINLITKEKIINKLVNLFLLLIFILSIFFVSNNNVIYTYIQMGIIYLIYPSIFNLENVNKK